MFAKADSESGAVPMVFNEEAIGLSLKELAVDIVQGETTDILSRWFHSTQDADLFIWTDGEKRVIKSQLCFYGQVIEWNPLDGTRTGLIVEEEALEKDENWSETIRFDTKPQSVSVEQAIRVLTHVPSLSDDERALLIHNLRESPKLHAKARERALKAWAPKAQEISTDKRPTFWRRLKKWVLG